jgi:hypothetical protein
MRRQDFVSSARATFESDFAADEKSPVMTIRKQHGLQQMPHYSNSPSLRLALALRIKHHARTDKKPRRTNGFNLSYKTNSSNSKGRLHVYAPTRTLRLESLNTHAAAKSPSLSFSLNFYWQSGIICHKVGSASSQMSSLIRAVLNLRTQR